VVEAAVKKIVPVWPWPMHPKVAEVLNPIPGITLVEALPGGPGPVLAIRKAPPFACDAVVLSRPEKAVQAVDLVTANGVELVTVRDWLSEALGGASIPFEKKEQRVKFQ
jgi:hypothetical protein